MSRNFGWVMAALAGPALLAACGGGGSGSSGGPTGYVITIENMAFSPAQLAVPAGETVHVVNKDGITSHSVTSAATLGDFNPGAVAGVSFDTGAFTGQAQFTVQANATDGTVIPYYCTVHKGAMATPNATIKIDSTAMPNVPLVSGGGMGGGGGY
jgi:plastocyanin